VTVRGGGEQLCVSPAEEVRKLPVVDAAFLDYRALLARLAPAQARAVMDRLALLNFLLPGHLPTPVVIDVGHDQLVLSTPDGRTRHDFSAVCTGGAVRLGVAPALLAGSLAVSVGPDVLLELAAPERAVVVRSADQGSFTVLRALLQVQPFRRYLLGQTLSALGDSLHADRAGLRRPLLRRWGGRSRLGVLLASRLPAILLALLGGAIGDRADRRSVLLLTDTGRCLCPGPALGTRGQR